MAVFWIVIRPFWDMWKWVLCKTEDTDRKSFFNPLLHSVIDVIIWHTKWCQKRVQLYAEMSTNQVDMFLFPTTMGIQSCRNLTAYMTVFSTNIDQTTYTFWACWSQIRPRFFNKFDCFCMRDLWRWHSRRCLLVALLSNNIDVDVDVAGRWILHHMWWSPGWSMYFSNCAF